MDTKKQIMVRDAAADSLLAVAALVFYACSLYPGVGGTSSPGDAAKFQCVGVLLGIPHAPGFPAYVVLSRMWDNVLGCLEPAIAQNLLSAAWAACALVLFRRAARAMGVGMVASVLGACGLGLGLQFWLDATEAGPASMSCALLAAVLWLLLRGTTPGRTGSLCAALGVACAAAGHDTIFLVLLPAVFVLATVFDHGIWRRRAAWLACAMGAAWVVLPYALVWLRMRNGAAMEYLHRGSSTRDLLLFALGAQFWPNWWQSGTRDIVCVRLPWLAEELACQMHTVGAALAALGLVLLWVRARRMAAVVCVTSVVAIAWPIHQYAVRIQANYWALYLCAALLAAVGLDLAMRAARTLWPVVALVYVAAIVVSIAVNQSHLFGRRAGFEYEELLLAAPRKAVWATDDQYTSQEVLRYYAAVNPFIARRGLVASDDLATYPNEHVFFIGERMRDTVVRGGGAAKVLCSNATDICYLATGRKL